MKKNLTVVVWALMMPIFVLAAERSAMDAAALAAEFMNQKAALSPSRGMAIGASSMVLSHTRQKLHSEEPAYYVFNQNGDGFVVVSADDRTEDILMYSEEGSLDVETANPNLKFWLKHIQEEISVANDENAIEKSPIRTAQTVTAIGPLLINDKGKAINWYQEAPYYNQCPLDGSKRSLTGCVATAAAMIMYMYRYPEKGTGYNSYTTRTKGLKVSQDFSAVTFDWANMLPSYYGKSSTTAQKNAVAWLMRCCGVACNMDYTNEGSGSFTDWMAYGLKKYLGYTFDKFVTTYSRIGYGGAAVDNSLCHWSAKTADFIDYFNADLEAGRPIIMGGEDATEQGGHEFVCDGRDTQGRFHINWGWEGSGNCYCALTALKPSDGSGYDFSTGIDAIIGLRPNIIDTVHVSSVSVSPASATLKINEKVLLEATISPANATDMSITWSCDNLKVASVSGEGEVTGVGAGTAVVTATSTDGKKKGSATITVTNEVVPILAYKWVKDANKLKAGDEIILVATYNGVHYAMDRAIHTSKNSYYFETEIEQIKDSVIILGDQSTALVLTLGGSKGAWTLTEAEFGKLGAIASKKLTWNDGSQTWKITSNTQGEATIENETTSYGKILFNNNSGSPRFTTYGNTSTTILLPEIFARIKEDTVVNVTGVVLGQNTAEMKLGETIKLHYSIFPSTATNQNVAWTTANNAIADVDANGNVSAKGVGQTTVTITTADGGFTADCAITVVDSAAAPKDTVYVSASEAKQLGLALGYGNTSTQFYGVKGYVTMPNSQAYNGFYIDDTFTNNQTFQGYNCKMPSGIVALEVGQYVCIYGYIANFENRKMQIKDGEVVLLDTPTSIMPVSGTQVAKQNVIKMIQGGVLYILRGDKMYNAQGQIVK